MDFYMDLLDNWNMAYCLNDTQMLTVMSLSYLEC